MDIRQALYALAAEHGLDKQGTARLQQCAGLGGEPAGLARWLPRGVAVLAAALGGFGLILWVAANWESLGRTGRFTLLQGTVVVMCLGALLRPAARVPLGLMALLGIGGLFAYFGQTYQTGADPWQLFALWAVLALPLCLGVRSDALWAPWALVVCCAISLWVHAHSGHRWWWPEHDSLGVHLAAWAACGALVLAMSAPAQRHTGAGVWALRTALTLSLVMITGSALEGLFSHRVTAHYGLGVLVLAAAAYALSRPALFDIFGLSGAALGFDTLLIFGLGRLLLGGSHHGDPIGELMLLGLAAAGLLAVTVSMILKLSRQMDGRPPSAGPHPWANRSDAQLPKQGDQA